MGFHTFHYKLNNYIFYANQLVCAGGKVDNSYTHTTYGDYFLPVLYSIVKLMTFFFFVILISFDLSNSSMQSCDK